MPETNKYACLPEDLLLQILEKTPDTASKLAESIQLSKHKNWRLVKFLKKERKIQF